MITLSDQIQLVNILTLEPRKSNVSINGNYIKIETINEYLARVPEENRYLGLELIVMSPVGDYDINTFVSLINTEQITYSKYSFTTTILDSGLIEIPKGTVIDNLITDSSIDALSAAQGKVLKDLFDQINVPEVDPVFTEWLTNTPPAYLSNIPTALSQLSEDTTHRVITDSERINWNSKASGSHNHSGVYEPANANIQTHIFNTNNPHTVTKTQVGLGNVPNVDTTNPTNITQDSTHRFVSDTEKSTWNSKQNAGTYSTDIHSNITALNNVSGVNSGDETTSTIKTKLGITTLSGSNTGDQDLSGYALTSHNHTGVYAPALGSDDNYVTDIEKAALHTHSNKTVLDNVSGTNTGDETLLSITTKLGTTLSNKLDYNGSGASLTGITSTQVGLSNVPNINATIASNIVEDSTHHFVTDSEKSIWNAKQVALGFTPENVANIRTTFQVTPDNTHYPSEKLVKDSLDAKQTAGTYSTDIHSNITALDAVSGTNTGDNATNTQYSGLATSKQDTLVSGTTIKTINGISVLGSGDIPISGAGGDVSGPASAVDGNIAVFSGITGKILKDTGVVVSGVNTGDSSGHTGLLPYTGATTDTDIGTHAIKASKYQFKTDAINTLTHGELGWNEHDLTLDLKTNGATLQINEEQVFPVKNATGSTLLNGRLVKITGYSSVDDYYTIQYSDNTSENTALVDFMLTENILPGAIGLGTKTGLVHDLDTSMGTISGTVYLGTNGTYIATPPAYPNKTVVIGIFGNINATAGDIFVDLARSTQYNINTLSSELDLKGMQNPGICQKCPILPIDIVIDTTALTLTIATVKGGQTITAANPIRFFTDGSGLINKWEKTSAVTFPAFTNTTGVWYFYFNNSGEPITTQNSWSDFNIIATIYRFYWNATLTGANRLVVESHEAHQNDISAADHAWKHAQGSIYENGLDMTSNILTTGAPNADGRNTCISLSTGKCSDDGLEWTVVNTTTPTNYFEQDMGNIVTASLTSSNSGLFRIRTNNANGVLNILPATRFPFLWNTGNNRPQYLTTTGVATDVPDDNWFVYYVYNLSDRKVGAPVKITSAEVVFGTLASAQAHSWEIMRSLYSTLKDNEIRPLYKIIFYTNNTGGGAYSAAVKYTVIREIADIRTQKTTTSVASAGSTLASNVVVTPSGDIASTNVQSALIELDTEKLPLIGANTITTVGTITTGTWNADVISILKGGTGLSTLGTALQLLRVNSGETALEYFTPTNTGTVTSIIAGTGLSGGTISTSGTIALATAYGDTINPYASKTANYFLAAPNGSAGSPVFRAIVAADIPTLNQNTTGTAATITGIYGGTITSSQITTGLGFTPYNATNPSGYTANVGTVTSVAALTLGTTGNDLSSTVATGTTTPVITLNVPTASATNRGALSSTDWTTFNNKTSNVGTVTSVGMTVPTGLTIGGTPITTSGTFALTLTGGYSIPTTSSQTNWDAAYTDRNKWDGGSTGLTATTGRTSLGATTIGDNLFTLTNPTAITFPRFNADNTVSALDASDFRTAIGAGTSTVTPSALTKTDDTNVTLTLGGTPGTSLLQAVSLTLGWTGTLADGRIASAATWNAKQIGNVNLTSLSSLTYASASFVKMTAAGTFALDTNSYYLSSNPSGYTTNTGTVTSVVAGTGLSGGTINTTGTIAVNYGTTSTTSCVGNDTRLSDARVASDVYAWAKTSVKPTYTASEVGALPYTGATSNINFGVHNLTVDTNTLFIDSVNHRIGVGTITPGWKVDVYGNINGNVGASYTNINTGTNAYANNLFKNSSNDEGYVGIGTVNNLDSGMARRTYLESYIGLGVSLIADAGDIRFYTGGAVDANEKMRIANDGKVGINTLAPAYTFDVNGTVRANSYNINNALSANLSYTGTYEIATVGESVVFGDVLYLKFSDGKYWKAKADAYTTTPATRMALATISADTTGNLLIEGLVRYDSWSFAANNVWLSAATAGAITTTQPATTGNQIQKIGIAFTSTKLQFRPSFDIGEK